MRHCELRKHKSSLYYRIPRQELQFLVLLVAGLPLLYSLVRVASQELLHKALLASKVLRVHKVIKVC